VNVLIQGTVPIILHGSDYPMPLNMSLPDNFPESYPLTQIPVTQGTTIIPSPALRKDGLIFVAEFFRWAPRTTSRATFVNAIIQKFSSVAPFTVSAPPPRAPPVMDFQTFRTTAESLADDANRATARTHEAHANVSQAEDYQRTVAGLHDRLRSEVDQLRRSAARPSVGQAQPVNIDPETERRVRLEAKKAAYTDTQQGLMTSFHRGEVDIDQLLKTTRELARTHFQSGIYPNM
jgi:hypothetical protein